MKRAAQYACSAHSLLATMTVAILTAGCCTSCASDKTEEVFPWSPFPPDAVYNGKTLSQWAADWFRWEFAQTSCELSPDSDQTGALCQAYQSPEDATFFFASGTTRTVVMRDQCVVPAGRALLIPLIGYSTDNAGVPEEQQKTEEELEREADEVRSTMSGLHLVVDGHTVPALEAYSVGPTRFFYDLPDEPNRYSCLLGLSGVVGRVDASFLTGYFVLMPAPPRGLHELEYGGAVFAKNGLADAGATYGVHVVSQFMVK